MTQKLIMFNVFGSVTIDQNRLVATAHAVGPGQHIYFVSRQVDMVAPYEIKWLDKLIGYPLIATYVSLVDGDRTPVLAVVPLVTPSRLTRADQDNILSSAPVHGAIIDTIGDLVAQVR